MNDLIRLATGDLSRFLAKALPAMGDNWWRCRVTDRLSPQQQRMVYERGISSLSQLDFAALLRVMEQNWSELSEGLRLPRDGRTWVKELQGVRNRWAHLSAEAVSAADVYRDVDTLERFLALIDAEPPSLAAVAAAKDAALAKMVGARDAAESDRPGARVVADLLRPIADDSQAISARPDKPSTAMYGFVPSAAAAALVPEHPQFEARTAILDVVDAFLRGEPVTGSDGLAVAPGERRILLFVGQQGIGKTSLLAHWVNRDHAEPPTAFFFRRDARQTSRDLLWHVCTDLQRAAETGSINTLRADDDLEGEARNLLQDRSARLGPERPMAIVVDGVDEAEDPEMVVRVVQRLSSTLPTYCQFVIASRPSEALGQRLSRCAVRIDLDPTSPGLAADVASYLEEWLVARPDGKAAKNELLPRLVEAADGNFAWAVQFCQTAEQGHFGLAERVPRLGELKGLPSLYGAAWQSAIDQLDARQRSAVEKTALVLACAMAPVTWPQVFRFAKTRPNHEPVVRDAMTQFLSTRPASTVDGHQTIELSHASFAEFLLSTIGSERDGHRLIARAYKREDVAEWDDYGLRCQVRHALSAGEHKRVAGSLEALGYVERKVRLGELADLISQYREAADRLPRSYGRSVHFRVLADALQHDLDFLLDHPEATFQTLFNRAWWHDCDEARHHLVNPIGGWGPNGPPWERTGPKLSTLMDDWWREKDERGKGFAWLRALRPQPEPLGAGVLIMRRPRHKWSPKFPPSDVPLEAVAWSPDGDALVAVGEGRVYVSEFGTWSWREVGHLGDGFHDVRCISCSRDAEVIAVCLSDRVALVCEDEDRSPMWAVKSDKPDLISGALADDCTALSVCSSAGGGIWQLPELTQRYAQAAPRRSISGIVPEHQVVSVCPGSNRMAAIDSYSGEGDRQSLGMRARYARVYSLAGMSEDSESATLRVIEGFWTGVCLAPGGKTVAVWGTDQEQQLVGVDDGSVRTVQSPSGIEGASFSANGRYAAFWSPRNAVVVRVSDGRRVAGYDSEGANIRGFALHPADRCFAVLDDAGAVRIVPFDYAVDLPAVHSQGTVGELVSLPPRHNQFITISAGLSISFWDTWHATPAGSPTSILRYSSAGTLVCALDLSTDGQLLAVSVEEVDYSSIIVLRVPTMEVVLQYPCNPDESPARARRICQSVELSPDSQRMVATMDDYSIHVISLFEERDWYCDKWAGTMDGPEIVEFTADGSAININDYGHKTRWDYLDGTFGAVEQPSQRKSRIFLAEPFGPMRTKIGDRPIHDLDGLPLAGWCTHSRRAGHHCAWIVARGEHVNVYVAEGGPPV